MTSEKKAEANRRNALKSTGPKTPEGKDAVRLNALRHGLRSEEILLPGEDEEVLRELDEHLRIELQPVGELESLFVDRIITAYWRLRRLGRVEAGIFAWQLYGELRERAQREARSYKRNILDDIVEQDTTITDEHKRQEALSKAQELNVKQEAETATLGRTFIRDANAANAFSKALHELQRLQAARRADDNAPPPLAIDVDVSGVSRDEH
jgi:hypothetical protein